MPRGIAVAMQFGMRGLDEFNGVILDHRVGDEFLAHGLDLGLGFGAVGFGQFDLEILALAHAIDAGKTK